MAFLDTTPALDRLTEKYEKVVGDYNLSRMYAYSEMMGMLTVSVELQNSVEQVQSLLDQVANGE